MDSKIYVWLFNNISRYEFRGYEANQIKASISRMLVTEASINSDMLVTKMHEYYSVFCRLFYNNIIGYQNGLAASGITSSELDCYLINTSDGMVPIGYYRSIRPAETVSMVQSYLDRCRKDINSERNRTVVKWQNSIDEISQRYELIKNSKNPSMARVIWGGVFSVAATVLSIISLFRINLIGVLLNWGNADVIRQALSGIPAISKGSLGAWIGSLIFIVCVLVCAAAGVVFTVREAKLIVAKYTTKKILSSTLSYVTGLEHGVSEAAENCPNVLYDAARKGENVKITPNANADLIKNAEKQINTADDYTSKSETQRTGIAYAMIALLAIAAFIFSLSYSRGFADGIENIRKSVHISSNPDSHSSDSANSSGNVSPIPVHTPAPTPTEKPKSSAYAAYKSDITWTEARRNAGLMGGYLVCINDREEFEKVCQKADEQNIKVFWVGAYRSSYDSWEDTKWEDGEDITFIKWLDGEPSYYENGDEENYLMVFKVKGEWYFNDAINDVSEYYSGKIGYIVETEE